ncbi:hypothetical protein BgiMline_010889, partial [Biomphalaria glabrata]
CLLLLAHHAATEIQDCTEDFKTCEDTYKKNILGPLNSQTSKANDICRVIVELQQCLSALTCSIPPEAKTETLDKYRKGLLKRNYSCDPYAELSHPVQETPKFRSHVSQKEKPTHIYKSNNGKRYLFFQNTHSRKPCKFKIKAESASDKISNF